MSEGNDSKNMKDKSYGTDVGGSITLGNISGQSIIGNKNIQIQNQSSPTVDIEKLKKSLLAFQEELDKLYLSPEDQGIVKGDVSAALKEAGKEEPKLSNIKTRVENIIETLKDAGKTVKNISEICSSLKIAAGLLGIAL